MKEDLLRTLDRRRPRIRARWEALLRLERPPTPLAQPDILIHLFDHTLNEVLSIVPRPLPESSVNRPDCQCRCNPLRLYFATLEQALLEALVLAQVEDPDLTPIERVASVGELCQRLRHVAQRELTLLDGLCRNRRPESPGP